MSNAKITGRFNYLSFKPNVYNVLFFPFRGSTATIVARNLDKKSALTFVEGLNCEIDDMRRDLEQEDDLEDDEL